MILLKRLSVWLIFGTVFCSLPSIATEFEITALFGQMYGSDLKSADGDIDISTDNGGNFALAIAWQDSPNGQGQIMINSVSHDFTSPVDTNKNGLNIIYAHFNGIAQFRQQSYMTTVSLGLGGAYFDSDFAEELYPSASIAVGTRYEFSDRLSFVTELRGYASIVDDQDDTFCQGEICHAKFSDTLWIDANISVGLAYKF